MPSAAHAANDPAAASQSAERAFPAHPCPSRYFPAASIEECRNRLTRAVQRGDGPAMVVGAPGMGKTMLLSVLAESIGDAFQIVLIKSTQLCTRRALLQAILFGLGRPYQDRDEGELRLALAGRLQSVDTGALPVALLIDEAQAMPVRLLEELRVMTNVTRGHEPMVRLVLAGTQGLEEHLASVEMESLNQRLAARCYLSPLSYEETHQYVRAHVAAAGAEPDQLFTTGALDRLYNATDGVPRLISQLCDRAVVMAVDAGVPTVDESLVQQAWSDLHQLPAPWDTPEASIPAPPADEEGGMSVEGNVIEFGVLPEEDEPTPNDLPQAAAAGVWNADEALAEIATDANASTEVQATPTPEEPTEEVAAEESTPVDTATAQPAAITPPAESMAMEPAAADETEPAPSETPTTEVTVAQATAATSDPFGDGFDEEELVIDRFAAIETAFAPSAPAVTNRQDPPIDFGLVAATPAEPTTEPVAEEPVHRAEGWTEEPVVSAYRDEAEHPLAQASVGPRVPSPIDPEGAVLPMTAPPAQELPVDEETDSHVPSDAIGDFDDCPVAVAAAAASCGVGCGCASTATTDQSVLIIEDDPAPLGAEPPQVKRQDYRQLFANLRRES